MTGMSLTLSIDHLILEKYRDEDGDHMRITRFGIRGEPLEDIDFILGDKIEACKFLSLISKSMGVGPVTCK